MLYSSQGQLVIFLIFFICGFACFYLFALLKLIKNIQGKYKKVVQAFLDAFLCVVLATIFVFVNQKVNYGEFRLFVLISYILGFVCNFYFNNYIKIKIKNKNNTKIHTS